MEIVRRKDEQVIKQSRDEEQNSKDELHGKQHGQHCMIQSVVVIRRLVTALLNRHDDAGRRCRRERQGRATGRVRECRVKG